MPKTDAPIRVLVCDEQPVVRAGLRALVGRPRDITVVGEAADCRGAATAMRRQVLDIAIVDLALPPSDGMDVLQLLRYAAVEGRTRTVVLAPDGSEENGVLALRAGARGLVPRRAPADQLVQAVRVVASGQALIMPPVAGRLLDWLGRTPFPAARPPEPAERLTGRERQVLELLANGWTTARIATALGLQQVTVRSHVHHVLVKLGLGNRTEAVVFAYQTGLVEPSDGSGPPAGGSTRDEPLS